MKIGIVGLGLIGGSIAKAYKLNEDNCVYGYDLNKTVLSFAKMSDAIDDVLTDENIKECDLIITAIYPKATIKFLEDKGSLIGENAIVVDTCGIKSAICEKGFEIAKEKNFRFVGGHPMAGKQLSGFKHSRDSLFSGAPMVIVPEDYNDLFFIDKVKEMLMPIGFSNVSVTTSKNHDEIIAYTSQMPHLVSNAFIKSETADKHRGFSAGSYNDLTRVAYLNEEMWSELFLDNSDHLINELDGFISELIKYREALTQHDKELLEKLLKEGREKKEKVDGKCR
ncbi:MAG: prephenate dehydrogenase [Clostridiales bacterium]|jgi:prephenate dehydrogenase|nr:prephenate dehydrogenase [Clostridiales bacterium]